MTTQRIVVRPEDGMTQRIVVDPANQTVNVLEAEQSVGVIVQAGPVGPPGPVVGVEGPPGEQGPPGETGLQGPEGPAGPQGDDGIQGEPGATGPQGDEGPQGIQGVEGPPGATGETGATGPAGDEGPPGGAFLSAFWQYSSTTGTPPGSGQMRTNVAMTELYISETDTDGFFRDVGLDLIAVDVRLSVRGTNGTNAEWVCNGAPVDNGGWRTIPISVISGTVSKGSRTQFAIMPDLPIGPEGPQGPTGDTGPQGPQGIQGPMGDTGPTGPGVPPGGTTGQALVKVDDTDFNTAWEDVATSSTMPTITESLSANLVIFIPLALAETVTPNPTEPIIIETITPTLHL